MGESRRYVNDINEVLVGRFFTKIFEKALACNEVGAVVACLRDGGTPVIEDNKLRYLTKEEARAWMIEHLGES